MRSRSWRAPVFAPDGHQRAGDRDLIGQPKKGELPETAGEVQRRGQSAGFQDRRSAARLDEVKPLVKLNPVRDAQAPVKIHQIDAAAQQHVLAIVDDFGTFAGYRVGSGAAAQESAGFEKIDLESRLAQRRSRGETGQTSADHDR